MSDFPKQSFHPAEKPERNASIYLEYKGGAKKSALAFRYQISPARVDQIIRKIEWRARRANP
mgnify:CR=1 FL=1